MYVSSIHRISVISNFSSRVYGVYVTFFFFFKQKTAYEMRISDWSSDVCSSDLKNHFRVRGDEARLPERLFRHLARHARPRADAVRQRPRFREGTRAEGAAGRGNLVPALFGALGRHRPRRPAYELRDRRQWLEDQREKGVDENGRAHVRTPVTHAHLVCSLLHVKN